MVYDRTLWRRLIHVADPTQWDKAWLLLFGVISSFEFETSCNYFSVMIFFYFEVTIHFDWYKKISVI